MNLRDLLNPDDNLVTGVCWYSAEQWAHLREIASDPDELEETYEEWLAMMKRTLRTLREGGLQYHLVDIDVEEFVSWCKRKGRPINDSSRAEYGAYVLQQQHEDSR